MLNVEKNITFTNYTEYILSLIHIYMEANRIIPKILKEEEKVEDSKK